MGLTVAQLFARVGVSGADSSVRTLKGVSGQVDATQRRMDGMGGASKRLTAGMAKVGAVAGGVLVAGMVGSAKAAMSWESAITGVAKTIEGDVSAIGKGIRDMALEMPIAATELAAIAEAGGALGVAKGDILGFTETVAKLGETTNLTADAAATGLGGLKTTLRLTGDEFEQVGDILVNLGNKGSSTESEILGMAENIAGAASAIGASKEQVLGWAAAMANTREEAEAGGSSIQRFWLGTFKHVQKGGAALKLLAKTAGMTAGQFKRAYEKDAAGTLQKFMVSLGKLTKAEQLATLEGLGFTDIRVTRALLKLLANTDNLTDSINNANSASGALGVESQKRFDTVASAVGTVKNAFFEMGVSIGTGMLPHIKRFADETVAFVKGNRDELAALGDDVGSFLGRIDMGEVLAMGRDLVTVMKDAAGFVLKILDAVNQLPGPIKAAGAGLLVLNKASGGAVSDILGGAAGSVVKGAAGRVPGLGSLVAQPVRVVNWPIGLGAGGGGLGGAVGAAGKGGGIGALGKVALVGETVGLAMAVYGVQQEVSAANSALAGEVRATSDAWIANNNVSRADLVKGLAAVDQGINDIQANPLNVLVSGSALDELRATRAGILTQIAATDRVREASSRTKDDLTAVGLKQVAAANAIATRVESVRASEINAASRTTAAITRVRDSVDASKIASVVAIRNKRFSADVTVRPQTAYFNIDGSRVARAIMPYVRPGQAPRAS